MFFPVTIIHFFFSSSSFLFLQLAEVQQSSSVFNSLFQIHLMCRKLIPFPAEIQSELWSEYKHYFLFNPPITELSSIRSSGTEYNTVWPLSDHWWLKESVQVWLQTIAKLLQLKGRVCWKQQMTKIRYNGLFTFFCKGTFIKAPLHLFDICSYFSDAVKRNIVIFLPLNFSHG